MAQLAVRVVRLDQSISSEAAVVARWIRGDGWRPLVSVGVPVGDVPSVDLSPSESLFMEPWGSK
jgi:hypothetical protein